MTIAAHNAINIICLCNIFMPFAAVLARAGRRSNHRLRRLSSGKGISWNGALPQCYGIFSIYKPSTHSVKESRLFSPRFAVPA